MDSSFENLCNMIKFEMNKKYGKAYNEDDYLNILRTIELVNSGDIDVYTIIFKNETSKILVNKKYKDNMHPDEIYYKIEGSLLNQQTYDYEIVTGSTPKDTGLVTELPEHNDSFRQFNETPIINLADGHTKRLFNESGDIWC